MMTQETIMSWIQSQMLMRRMLAIGACCEQRVPLFVIETALEDKVEIVARTAVRACKCQLYPLETLEKWSHGTKYQRLAVIAMYEYHDLPGWLLVPALVDEECPEVLCAAVEACIKKRIREEKGGRLQGESCD